MQKIFRTHTDNITWYIPEDGGQTIRDKLKDFNDSIREQTTTVHKKGRRKVFASLGTTTDGEEIYLKTFRLTNFSLKLKHIFLRSKALRELIVGLTAVERGVPAMVPLAAGEKRRMGLVEECYILLKKIEGAVNLSDYFKQASIPQHHRARVIETLGRLARKSHESGIFQTDFSLNNFLLMNPETSTPTIYIIDFERTYIHNRLSEDMRNWALAKLNRVGAYFSAADKLRFLKAYSAGKGITKTSLGPWIRELDRHTYWILRKDALRIHRASVRGDRGYRLHANGNLRVYSLEGYSTEKLIRLTDDLNEEETMETPGPFRLCRARSKMYTNGTEMAVDIYKFLPSRSRPTSARPAMEAWQTANALAKANIAVSQAIGAVESGEGTSYQGYLIVRYVPGLKGLRTAIGESPPDSEKRYKLLWHTTSFLSRLHNHGTQLAPISEGDIAIRESPEGRIKPCLVRPFKFAMALTMDGARSEDRESDLRRLEAFLEDLLEEKERAQLRRLYRLHTSNIPSHGETLSSYTPGRWSRFRSL